MQRRSTRTYGSPALNLRALVPSFLFSIAAWVTSITLGKMDPVRFGILSAICGFGAWLYSRLSKESSGKLRITYRIGSIFYFVFALFIFAGVFIR